MGTTARNLVAILVLVVALGVAGYYVYSQMETRENRRAGDVYDYRKDKALVQTVRTALSMEAFMTRLTTPTRDGVTPEVKYGLDSVAKGGTGPGGGAIPPLYPDHLRNHPEGGPQKVPAEAGRHLGRGQVKRNLGKGMNHFLKITLVLALLALGPTGPSRAAMAVVQEAAQASLKCGCTVRKADGDIRVVVKSVSKAWQENGKKCRSLRITVFKKDKMIYNGIQRACEP